jgi:hypothetical protein
MLRGERPDGGMRVRGGRSDLAPHTPRPPILSDVLALESNFLIPTATLTVLLVLLMMLVVFGGLIAWLLSFFIGRRETAPQGQTGNDPSRR